MAAREKDPERARRVRETTAAVTSLRRTLGQLWRGYSDAPSITVRVGPNGKQGETSIGPGSAAAFRLIISIEADTQEHAEEHAQELANQGCTCTSTGETSVECDCSDVA